MIKKGQFKLVYLESNADDKKKCNLMRNVKGRIKYREIIIMSAGECFGYSELIDNRKRMYDIICDSDSGTVLEMGYLDFFNYF